MKPRILEIRRGVLEKNDRLAHELRQKFDDAGVLVLNLVSSPGSGKTALLEITLKRLQEQGYSVAALVGDLATENDAQRLARSQATVRQIVTAGTCHLEAQMVSEHLSDWNLADYDFLFIENVGNLVCPSSYDLGEHVRAVLLSVTEGEDKPLKYPPMFQSSDVAIITKIDLAEAVEFDRKTTLVNIARICAGVPVLETSSKTMQGIDDWLNYLVKQHKQFKKPEAEHI